MAKDTTPQEYADRLAETAKSGDNEAFRQTFNEVQNEDYATRAATFTNLRGRK